MRFGHFGKRIVAATTPSSVLMRKSLGVLGLSFILGLSAAWSVTAVHCGDSATTSSPMQESLESSAAKFIKILREKNVAGLLSEFSRNGAYLGVDSGRFPYKVIVKSLNEKGEFYFDFFETRLFDGKRDPNRVPSLRDQVLEAKVTRFHASLESEKGKTYGSVTIIVVGNPVYGNGGEAICDLVYVRENGEWKITNVQYL
jgi:hypothetical protein